MALGTVGKIYLEDIDENQFKNDILLELTRQFNVLMERILASNRFIREIEQSINIKLKSEPEYSALVSGSLKQVFGISNGEQVTNNISSAIVRAMEVEFNRAVFNGGGITGNVIIRLSRKDLSDVLSVEGSSYSSKGGEVSWLRWLLTAGDSIIIANFDVSFQNDEHSRAGGAIMTRSNSGFRVPPEYSGTEDNNWITRALSDMDVSIGNLLQIHILDGLR